MSNVEIDQETELPTSFEGALNALEAIVVELEAGNLKLDESVSRFRRASELADHCKVLITEARLRVTELQAGLPTSAPADGADNDVPF